MVYGKMCVLVSIMISKGLNESVYKAKRNCIKLGNYLSLDIDESDVNELLKSHNQGLISRDLLELGKHMETDENYEAEL